MGVSRGVGDGGGMGVHRWDGEDVMLALVGGGGDGGGCGGPPSPAPAPCPRRGTSASAAPTARCQNCSGPHATQISCQRSGARLRCQEGEEGEGLTCTRLRAPSSGRSPTPARVTRTECSMYHKVSGRGPMGPPTLLQECCVVLTDLRRHPLGGAARARHGVGEGLEAGQPEVADLGLETVVQQDCIRDDKTGA